MKIKSLFIITYIALSSLWITNCAQVATGAAVKVVTVNQEDRSIGEFVDDTIIKTIIKNAYFDQNENLFFNIDVEVSQARVLLTGTVENIDLKIEATRIAWGASGVVISTKVKGKLILHENVNSLNYNIETVNKLVYIIGIAESESEKNLVIDIAQDVYGVEEVIDYISIKKSEI